MKTEKQFKKNRISSIIGYGLWCILNSVILLFVWTDTKTQMDALIFISTIFGYMLVSGIILLVFNIRGTYGKYLNELKKMNDRNIEKNLKDVDILKDENEKITNLKT